MTIDRRSLLNYAALGPLASAFAPLGRGAESAADAKADYTLRIGRGTVELAPGHLVSTTLYNGQFPGPLLRFTEGKLAIVDIYNDTDTPDVVHWHGQMISSDVDGEIEEGTPVIPPQVMRRISFVPKPAGFRFLHTHAGAGSDLTKGAYSGRAAPVYIEPKANVGAYDREVSLVLKESEPSFSHGGDMDMKFLAGDASKELNAFGKAADETSK